MRKTAARMRKNSAARVVRTSRGEARVVIARPTTPERTERELGVSRARSAHIKDLVEAIVGAD